MSDDDSGGSGDTSHLFVNRKHASALVGHLVALYEAGLFVDVVLTCGGDRSEKSDNDAGLPCHRLVLCSFSAYFRAMFTSDMLEAHSSRVHLAAIDDAEDDSETLAAVVRYAYTGAIRLDVASAPRVFALASLLECDAELVDACVRFMARHTDTSNALDVYRLAKRHSCTPLLAKARHFIEQHIGELIAPPHAAAGSCNAIAMLECDDTSALVEVLASDELELDDESRVLDFWLRWARHAPTPQRRRTASLARLVADTVRFELMAEETWRRLLQQDGTLLLSDLNVNVRSGTSGGVRQRRTGMRKAEQCFVLIGGNQSLEADVNCVNPFNGDKFIMSRHHSGASKRPSCHVENPGVCVDDVSGRLFVAGGNYVYHHNESGADGEAEAGRPTQVISKETYEYEEASDVWRRRANMLFAKANCTLCAMHARVYSFGGVATRHTDQLLDIVECFDVEANSWSYVGTMPQPFIDGYVVRHGDTFYVMGGRSGVGRFDNCYSYRPSTSSGGGEWCTLSSMRVGRFNFGACVLNDAHIYVFGGQRYNESSGSAYFTRESLDSVEIYDIAGDRWTRGARMPGSLYNTGVCVDSTRCVYVCGTTECKYSSPRLHGVGDGDGQRTASSLFGFVYTSVYRLEIDDDDDATVLDDNDVDERTRQRMKWNVVEHDVSEIKANYRCVSLQLNVTRLTKAHSFSPTKK